MMNCWLYVLCLSVALIAGGCKSTFTFVGAITCQGLWNPPVRDVAEPWRFRGIDGRVRPRIRPGSYASATHGIEFVEPDDLGPHAYRLKWSEKNGIVYTCRGGHIDIAHVRKAIDWAGFLAAVTLDNIRLERTGFAFKLREPSRYHVTFTYPNQWHATTPERREHIAREVAISLGRHFAYVATTWHEILTWYGYKPKGLRPAFESAFAWEDIYSNLLGTHVAARALRDQERSFEIAAELALDHYLQLLGAQPAIVGRRASEKVKGRWYRSKGIFTIIAHRNLDIGTGDGLVSPSLVNSVSDCPDAKPYLLPVPDLTAVEKNGFRIELEIEPREWEKSRILEAARLDSHDSKRRIRPQVHFPILLEHIRNQAVNRCGHKVKVQGI